MDSISTEDLGAKPSPSTSTTAHTCERAEFGVFTAAVQKALEKALALGGGALFTVSTEGLWEAYLDSFGEDLVERQQHDCRACQSFIRRWGGAIWLDRSGRGGSALWAYTAEMELPPMFRRAMVALWNMVEARFVTQQLIWRERRWGTQQAGGYTHLWADVAPPAFNVTRTPAQEQAHRRESFKALSLALSSPEFELHHLERAVGMLELGELDDGAKFAPWARFLCDTKERLHGAKGESRRRILWAAVGRAPEGWCSPRDSIVGSLLGDIAEGHAVDFIQRQHGKRVDPGRYQRPQAPPSAGNIAQAEKLFADLGLAPALPRKPLAFEDAQTFWSPRPIAPRSLGGGGVFGELLAPGPPLTASPLAAAPVTMTWAKFARDVLPSVRELSLFTPDSGSYGGLVTETNAGAPPLLRWDDAEARNPVSWYLGIRPTLAKRWSLTPRRYVQVLGLCELPCLWKQRRPRDEALAGGRVLAVLEGARDARAGKLPLFPETLRSELHPVRATIEAYAKRHTLDAEPRPHASGYLINCGGAVLLKARTPAGTVDYRIDRAE